MENRKGSGIFLGVIGVATLIVAIIGATFAFFGANAYSNESAVAATGAVLKLGYTDNTDGLKYNLIPAADYLALFAGMNEEEWYGEDVTNGGERCKDEVGNEICGIYEFTIGNPSFTTQQGLFGNIKAVLGDQATQFTNLYFAIYDETGAQVVAPTNFFDTADDDGVIPLTNLTQQLLPSSLDKDNSNFKEDDPSTYTPICTYGSTYDDDANPDTAEVNCTVTNVRTYEMVLWIHETGDDQTDEDSGKIFAAGINFTSANDTQGVTGVISAAEKNNPNQG